MESKEGWLQNNKPETISEVCLSHCPGFVRLISANPPGFNGSFPNINYIRDDRTTRHYLGDHRKMLPGENSNK
jgi:hypothetical protein